MKLRDEIIQDMYDMANNEELFEGMQTGFDRLDKYITSILPDGEKDERMDEGMGLICSLEHAAFSPERIWSLISYPEKRCSKCR